MNIKIIIRTNATQWGGDMTVISQIIAGLIKIGIDVELISAPFKIEKGTRYILTNTCLDQNTIMSKFINEKYHYYTLPFHEDLRKYFLPSTGMFIIAKQLLNSSNHSNILTELERFPEIINYPNISIPTTAVNNRHVLFNSTKIFPSSLQEEVTIKRDCPYSNIKTIKFPTAINDRFNNLMHSDSFIKNYNIPPGYIIQVGRLETRKNQLGTVLASRDIPIPLVFIASKGYQKEYEKTLINLIKKYRKYPTYLISQNMDEMHDGILYIKKMKNGEKMSWDELQSAYQNSIVNCHPAFYELPGLTYIESNQLGVKTIASKYASISEYMILDPNGSAVSFVDPTNIIDIKEALISCIYYNRTKNYSTPLITIDDYAGQIASEILN